MPIDTPVLTAVNISSRPKKVIQLDIWGLWGLPDPLVDFPHVHVFGCGNSLVLTPPPHPKFTKAEWQITKQLTVAGPVTMLFQLVSQVVGGGILGSLKAPVAYKGMVISRVSATYAQHASIHTIFASDLGVVEIDLGCPYFPVTDEYNNDLGLITDYTGGAGPFLGLNARASRAGKILLAGYAPLNTLAGATVSGYVKDSWDQKWPWGPVTFVNDSEGAVVALAQKTSTQT